jgi:hypothetical protein
LLSSSSPTFITEQEKENKESQLPLKFLHNVIRVLNDDRIHGSDDKKAYVKSIIQRAALEDYNIKTVEMGPTNPINQQNQIQQFKHNPVVNPEFDLRGETK